MALFGAGGYSSDVFGTTGKVIPRVGTLTSTALTVDQTNKIWQNLLLQMMGIDTDEDSDTFDPLAYAKARIDFQPEGQPGWEINEEVAFVSCFVMPDDPYTKVRDVEIVQNDDVSYLKRTVYTRVWRVNFKIYGPQSDSDAAQVKSLLYYDFVHDTLAESNLYLQTDFEDPRRSPENFTKQWWEAWELDVQMNEQVTETMILPTIGSVEIIIEDAQGIIYDQTVEL